jgi:ribosomal protein L32
MGIYRYNPLREQRMQKAEQWLRDKNCGSPIYAGGVCPRCGLKLLKDEMDIRSRYEDSVICGICRDDEILRDSVGADQMELSDWYVFSHGEAAANE